MTFVGLEAWLDDARSGLLRQTPEQAAAAVGDGAVLVDIRPAWQRRTEGEIPGSVVVETNHIAWRLHPDSDARLTIARPGQPWIVVCSEGYTSSLVAAWLVALGLDATDLVGGFHAWQAAGLPTTRSTTEVERRVGSDEPVGRVTAAAH
ncbi:rhodanese-like domain-containing protein [Mumia zhuanghuii]|uniref:Rhodanese-like domain-containing protein n=2 Tax=Mumia TaxID=1546255 RepID=A0ABW1QKU2_9ACTN|nr:MULTISPECIES: rhodanese-like domain-containing protein [Mumia]KAA1418246.1 rhodanese-like domain-containing protein [Mumia zhuanghuii]